MKKVEAYYFPITLLRGFIDNPQDAMQDFLNYIMLAEFDNLQDAKVKEDEALHFVCQLLGTRTHNWQTKEKRNRIKERTKGETKAPFTHIKRSIFWQWEDRYRPQTDKVEPTESETASLLCYLGLISIAGKLIDKEVKTTQEMLFARMSGNVKHTGKESIDVRLCKYQTRKRFENLKRDVEETFNVEFKRGKQRGVNFKVTPKKKQ